MLDQGVRSDGEYRGMMLDQGVRSASDVMANMEG